MRFIIDNALSWRLARGLTKGGHDAVHLQTLNMGDDEDEDIFEYAGKDGRFIITRDSDFDKLISEHQSVQPSVILLRVSETRPSPLVTMLLSVLPSLQADLEAGAYIVITDDAIHIRRLA
jgi:predicted nuclease of predicted toxin-antitoxin system